MRVAIGAAAALLVLGTDPAAWATPITFAFSGEVTSNTLGVAVGTPISGRYTFDSATTDSLPLDTTEGRYFSSSTEAGWYVRIGSGVLTTQPSSGTRVSTRVFNDHVVGTTPSDGYVAAGFGLGGELGSNLVIEIGNILEPTSLFASDALLSTPPTLSNASGRILTGSLTSVMNFSVSLPLTLSTDPFPGAIPPPAGGGGGGSSVGGGTTPPAIDPGACIGVTDPEGRVLCLVNDVRTRNGLGALSIDSALDTAAYKHVLDMHDNAFLGHTGSDGSQFYTRALAAGYTGNALDELIGAGFSVADTMVQAWLDSELHRNLVLDNRVDEAGVGYLEDGSTRLWDMLLGRAPAASAPSPATMPLLGIALCFLIFARRNMQRSS